MMVIVSGHLTKITCEFLLRAGSYTRKSTYEQLGMCFQLWDCIANFSTLCVVIGLKFTELPLSCPMTGFRCGCLLIMEFC